MEGSKVEAYQYRTCTSFSDTAHHSVDFDLPFADPETQIATDKTRKLGLVVVRGTQVSLISPQDGVEEIANPFIVADENEDE